MSNPVKEYLLNIADGFDSPNWRQRERARYAVGYGSGNYIPKKCIGQWEHLASGIKQTGNFKNDKILDVGCGPGFGVLIGRRHGLNVFGIDITDELGIWWRRLEINNCTSVAFGDILPFKDKTFGLVTCFDVMEHIPEEAVMDTLKEIKRVCSNTVSFLISNGLAEFHIMGTQIHQTVKSREWWKERLESIGFKITQSSKVDRHENVCKIAECAFVVEV